MNLPILILRPADGAQKTVSCASKMGLEVVVDPLFEIRPDKWDAPPTSGFDALMLTSANTVKHAGPKLQQYRQLPVLAVGEATAVAAEEMGFQVTHTGVGGVQALLDLLAPNQYRRILHLTGKHHVEINMPDRCIEMRTVYESRALPLGNAARRCLAEGTVVLLHSTRAAKTLSDEMDRLNLDRTASRVLALSGKIAEVAGTGWKSVQAAPDPTDDALLSLAGTLCHSDTETHAAPGNLGEQKEPE